MNQLGVQKCPKQKKVMQVNDLVILYKSHTEADHMYLSHKAVFDNKFGQFYHDDFIGQDFGSRIKSRHGSGWVLALQPTTELMSTAVRTRTQIVNDTDCSIITMNLDLFPGCVVVESGTGSGNMTLAVAKCVAPHGHIHSYEYNGSRAESARADFAKMGMSDLITVYHRDVCGMQDDSTGGFEGVEKHSVDAVFLDLPNPWLAIGHSKHVLKPGRNICCYSPCMEQVMKTCESLREEGFCCIKMVEVRQRPFDAKFVQLDTPDVGRNSNNIVTVDIATGTFEDPVPPPHKEGGQLSGPSSGDRKVVEEDKGDQEEGGLRQGQGESETKSSSSSSRKRKYLKIPEPPYSLLCARPENSMKGHTAFLTFAYSPLPSVAI